jgi:hypothetical protein
VGGIATGLLLHHSCLHSPDTQDEFAEQVQEMIRTSRGLLFACIRLCSHSRTFVLHAHIPSQFTWYVWTIANTFYFDYRHTGANADGEPLPVSSRVAHAAVALDEDVYIFGGERESTLLQELCIVQTADKQVSVRSRHIRPFIFAELPYTFSIKSV